MQSILTCQWCGHSGLTEEFELDTIHDDGFWCPYCDGHTFYDPEKNQKRRIMLILETESPVGANHFKEKSAKKLKKWISPLRYPGGKSRLIDLLYQQFLHDKLDLFVEVFAGGASVGLSLLDAGIIKHLVLNDYDSGIYSFWKTVTTNSDALISRINRITPTKELFYSAQEMLSTPQYFNELDLAWAQLVCNRLAFSGIANAHPMSDLLSRWNPQTLIKRIQKISQMADCITVCQIDAVELIESSAYWNDRSTCFIDPPYVKQGKNLYRKYFEDEDHEQLAWLLQSLYQGMPGADLVITYDDCEFIRNLYPFAEKLLIQRQYSC